MYSAEAAKVEDVEVIPKPTGYRILLAIPAVKEKTDGGIIRPDLFRTREETASIVANVVALGPDAYKDSDKFPSGPYCKQGDWVVISSYSGVRFKVRGQEFRLVNDDTPQGVVEDPRFVERV